MPTKHVPYVQHWMLSPPLQNPGVEVPLRSEHLLVEMHSPNISLGLTWQSSLLSGGSSLGMQHCGYVRDQACKERKRGRTCTSVGPSQRPGTDSAFAFWHDFVVIQVPEMPSLVLHVSPTPVGW